MNKTACKALALDLDGTLTNGEKTITPATRAAVRDAINGGVHIILASGRPVFGVLPAARTLGLFERGGFILAYNGGVIIDCKTNTTIFERLLPAECYPEICALARGAGLCALTYDGKGVIAESDTDPYCLREAFNNAAAIKKVPVLEKAVTFPSAKFMVVGEPQKIAKLLPAAREVFKGRVNVFLSEPYFMELTPPGVEKAAALNVLIKYLGITRKSLTACGDGLNDLQMLRFAGYAVAMGNAYDEIKQAADYVTLSNEEDGVADFLRKTILAP